MMQGMVIDMGEARLQTLAQIKAFLDGTTGIPFRVPKAERYRFIERVLNRLGYARIHGQTGCVAALSGVSIIGSVLTLKQFV